MNKTPEIRDGFVQISIKDAVKIASLLRGYEEILYVANSPKKERLNVQSTAYALENAHSNYLKLNAKE